MWKGDACLAVEAPGSVVVDGSPDPQLEPKVEETTLEVRIETLSLLLAVVAAVVGRDEPLQQGGERVHGEPAGGQGAR